MYRMYPTNASNTILLITVTIFLAVFGNMSVKIVIEGDAFFLSPILPPMNVIQIKQKIANSSDQNRGDFNTYRKKTPPANEISKVAAKIIANTFSILNTISLILFI